MRERRDGRRGPGALCPRLAVLTAGALLSAPWIAAAGSEASTARGEDSRPELARWEELEANEPATVLLRRGELFLLDPEGGETGSTLRIEMRLLISTAAGAARYGRLHLPSTTAAGLTDFSGRTVLPSGEVLPVTEDAIFVSPDGTHVTVVFPGVEVGAILDYRFEMRFESAFYQGSWLFQSGLPTRRSEMTYWIPSSLETREWQRIAPGLSLGRSLSKVDRGSRLDLWMEDLPGVAMEPYGPSLEEQASQFALLVTGGIELGPSVVRLDTWSDIRRAAERLYGAERAKRRRVRLLGRQIVERVAGKRQEDRARELFRFVRDELETEGPGEILPAPRAGGLDAALLAGSATVAEKALLLQVLLETADIASHLVWAPDTELRHLDYEHPNPLWLKRVLVGARIDGRTVHLDPSDPRLAFGSLAPGTEGSTALALGGRGVERLTLPVSPASQNGREMQIDLALGDDGRWRGRGRLAYTGLAAWHELASHGDPCGSVAYSFRESILSTWRGFEIADLEIECTREKELFVTWTMTQREVSAAAQMSQLRLARPWPPRVDASALTPTRRTPVRLPFAFEDSVEVRLRWSPSWEIDALPPDLEHRSPVGELTRTTLVEGHGQRLHHEARFLVRQREVPVDSYPALRDLLILAEQEDGQSVVLARRQSSLARTDPSAPEDWAAAGQRYERLGGRPPAVPDAVRAIARSLLRETHDSEELIEALLRLVRTEVDYLFVPERPEPYRPDPPATVLARGWGDCKDKTFLLIAALTAAGIEAHPLLVTMDPKAIVDPERPTLSLFDHVLVAARLGARLYFLEPSQCRGGLRWLPPALQDRNALLVDGAASRLVRTPLHPDAERREVALSLNVSLDGAASGTARLRLEGQTAMPFLDALAAPAPGQPTAADLRLPLKRLLSGHASLVPRRWQRAGGSVPTIEIEGEVRLDGLLETTRSQAFLTLPLLFELPHPQSVVGREVLPLPLGTTRTIWTLRIPDGCRAVDASIETENGVGRFRHRVSARGNEITVESELELRRPRVGPEEASAVSELGAAAVRARHVGLLCLDSGVAGEIGQSTRPPDERTGPSAGRSLLTVHPSRGR